MDKGKPPRADVFPHAYTDHRTGKKKTGSPRNLLVKSAREKESRDGGAVGACESY